MCVLPLRELTLFLPIDLIPDLRLRSHKYWFAGSWECCVMCFRCPGPLSNTVDDFWRMVWVFKSELIVMMSLMYEAGKVRLPSWKNLLISEV